MRPYGDPLGEVVNRQRARSRVRMITLAAGAAGLATAGYIASQLPAPPARPASTGTAGTTPAAAPAATSPAPSYGDDGGENEGGAASTPAAAPTGGAPATSHATSGGS